MKDLALQMPLAIMGLSILSMLFGLIYIILAEPRKKVASGRCTCPCRDCQYRNPSQTDSEVTNPPALTTESFESDTSRSSPYPNACQGHSEVPNPPPATDPSIIDYYWHYYCYYHDYYFPNNCQNNSEVTNSLPLTTESPESYVRDLSPCSNTCQGQSEFPKPPPVTDVSIVYYYYYYYRYYDYYYHRPNDCQTDSEVTNSLSSTPESSRSAPSSGSSARVPQPMNTGRPRVPILKSVYMTNSASRIPRPIKRYGLHCGSRNKKVAFGETQVIQV